VVAGLDAPGRVDQIVEGGRRSAERAAGRDEHREPRNENDDAEQPRDMADRPGRDDHARSEADEPQETDEEDEAEQAAEASPPAATAAHPGIAARRRPLLVVRPPGRAIAGEPSTVPPGRA
jgi:hypothetical protein